MTVFGVTIPLWIIVALVFAVFLFRREIQAFLNKLFDRFLSKPKPVVDEETARKLVLQALSQHGINIQDLQQLDGQKLVNVLKAFVAFASALASLTPGQVDDAVVKAASALVAFLEDNPDIANSIASVLGRLFKS